MADCLPLFDLFYSRLSKKALFAKFMKVNAEVGICNIQSPLQYSAVKQLASDYQKAGANISHFPVLYIAQVNTTCLFFTIMLLWNFYAVKIKSKFLAGDCWVSDRVTSKIETFGQIFYLN